MDERVVALAAATTIAAIVDTLLPTPEDLFPILGWIDEAVLWGLAAKLWIAAAQGKKLEELFTPSSWD